MLLTRKETADLLRVNLDTIYRWTRDGKLPFLRFGNSMRFEYDVVMEYGKSRCKSEAEVKRGR